MNFFKRLFSSSNLELEINDGGRAAAGYKGKAGDCVVRSIAIVTKLPYQKIYDDLYKADDVIFNFFKQICDEKDDVKCVELGNSWINAMKTNLTNMEKNLEEADKAKHQENIDSNMNHLNNLKDKSAEKWREYATQCMVEILDHKTKL